MKIMKKKITELYYMLKFSNKLNNEEKAEVKFMLSIFKDKRTHRPYITGSEKVRNVAYELGYQVTTKRNDLGYFEIYPNTVF